MLIGAPCSLICRRAKIRGSFRLLALVLVSLTLSAVSHADEGQAPRTALKICADPNSLPSSNKSLQGYENQIAALFARQLGLPVTYVWFPQRIGFIRNTLTSNDTPDGSYKCDLVLSVVEHFDMAATTRPYMRSTWAMVYVKGRGLDYIQSQEDLVNSTPEQRAALRIGAWDKGSATQWLAQNDLMERVSPYQSMSGDADVTPGKIIERDLVQDKINLTFLWGPIAGYYAQQIKGAQIRVIPLHNEPGLRFDFQIAMAVRFGDKLWKTQVEKLLKDNQVEIDIILKSFGVPLLPVLVDNTNVEAGD